MTMLSKLLEESLDGCWSDACNLHSTTRMDIMNLNILSTNKYSTFQEGLEDAISIEQSILIEGTRLLASSEKMVTSVISKNRPRFRQVWWPRVL